MRPQSTASNRSQAVTKTSRSDRVHSVAHRLETAAQDGLTRVGVRCRAMAASATRPDVPEDPDAMQRFLAQFPVTSNERPIVRYTFEHDGLLAYSFQTTARRVAATFTGSAPDDLLLMPYLYLYRHAIELALKDSIVYAAGVRRYRGDTDLELDPAELAKRIKNPRDLGHRLPALLDELDTHLTALDVERMPEKTDQLIRALAAADPDGQQFRYRTNPPTEQLYIDFDNLTEQLDEALGIVGAVKDVLEAFVEADAAWRGYSAGYVEGLNEPS